MGGLFQQQLNYPKKFFYGEKNDFSPISDMLKLPWQWRRNPDLRVKNFFLKFFLKIIYSLKKYLK